MDTESFPRGGEIQKKVKKRKFELFHVSQRQKKKNVKPSREEITEDSWHLSVNFDGTLTYNKMQEGMTVLACVRAISNLALQIEFPSFTYGLVTINRISDCFTDKLTTEFKKDSGESHIVLRRMIKVGDLVPAKILTIDHTDKGHTVQASLNPRDVNVHKTHRTFKKGSKIWANVISELDHGYELCTGVKHCRVFLPHKNVEIDRKYDIGEPLYCIIHKVVTSDTATTLTVSAKLEHLEKIQIAGNFNIDDIIPGTKIKFTVEEVLPHGIRGSLLEKCLAFIAESQIFSKININNVAEGSTLEAYVLFVEPITKVTYLTLRNLERLPLAEYEIGKIMSAKILSNAPNGLYLKLGKVNTGFITNKRLLKTLPNDACLDIISAIQKKYTLGSRHMCRILDYNHMQQSYICTFEQHLIKEEVFSSKNLKVGQKVTVTIHKIMLNGLVVKTGQLQGFVPNLHLSNTKYSEAIKKKFSVGMTVDARVLNITSDENIIFTLKQGLVESEKCLTNKDQTRPKSNYVGVIVQTKLSGALVAFYGEMKGWISMKNFNSGDDESSMNPRAFFFIGQVVSVWIKGCKNERLLLSLTDPNDEIIIKKIGDRKNAGMVQPDKVDVEVEGRKRKKETIVQIDKVDMEVEGRKRKKRAIVQPDEVDMEVEGRKRKKRTVQPDQVDTEIKERKRKKGAIVQPDKVEIEVEEHKINTVMPVAHLEKNGSTYENDSTNNTTLVPVKDVHLSGIETFYESQICKSSSDESSAEEEAEEGHQVKKRKKLTMQEKTEMRKKEDDRIADIEKQLVDATESPESVEQFDRLLLAHPNSSELWLKYMAMHIATTELEKARTVGQRALDTIDMTLVNEKFNIWMALLNLENMYGTKESFEKVFENAVKYNDSLKVYLSVIKLLATSGKINEMEEKIRKIKSKEKQNSKMWLEIARVYYSLENYKEARNIKEAALKSITDKKRQFDLIIKFGVMEFQNGDLEEAVANFETILDTYPSKIHIWMLYVDQLIKKKKIDAARNLLERASKQKFPLKSMKAILHKFINFEEQFGTRESVEGVKMKAKEYVQCVKLK